MEASRKVSLGSSSLKGIDDELRQAHAIGSGHSVPGAMDVGSRCAFRAQRRRNPSGNRIGLAGGSRDPRCRRLSRGSHHRVFRAAANPIRNGVRRNLAPLASAACANVVGANAAHLSLVHTPRRFRPMVFRHPSADALVVRNVDPALLCLSAIDSLRQRFGTTRASRFQRTGLFGPCPPCR